MSSSTSHKSSGDTTASPAKENEAPAPETASDTDSAGTSEAASAEESVGAKLDRADADGQSGGAGSEPGEAEDARADDERDDRGRDADTAAVSANADASDHGASEVAADDSDDDADEEPLDLRALFASSEPEFANPTETFELARGAKPEPRASAPDHSAASGDHDSLLSTGDTELPYDLPAEGMLGESDAQDDAGTSPGFASFGGAAPQGDEANALSGTPGDPLADAVQSALRSVYGDNDDSDTPGQQSAAFETGASGPILQWAGSGAASDANDPAAREDTRGASAGNDPQDTTAIDEETTEAVLSYLYEHIGSEGSGETSAPSDPGGAREALEARHDPDQRIEEAWTYQARASEPSIPPAHDSEYERAQPSAMDDAARVMHAQSTEADAGSAPAAETFHAPIDAGAAQYEASGKLLGAAGLGLIGGIAAAGVAAVFVFNSFVTQPDSTGAQQTTATAAEQDAQAPQTTASGADENQAGAADRESAGTQQASTAADGTETAAREAGETVAAISGDEATAGDSAEAETTAAIGARNVTGTADQAIPLALSVPDGDGDRFVRITGLPDGVKLSAGVDTGDGSWLLSAGRAENLALTAPDTLSGVFTLDAQLLGADARTPLSDDASFEVEVAGATIAEAEAGETRTAAFDPETTPQDTGEQPLAPMDRAESLLRSGDVRAAREILRTETGDNNAEAALALGRSYDPRTFTGLTSANASPDATEAFRWYQRAAELGNPNGSSQISELKAWLLR